LASETIEERGEERGEERARRKGRRAVYWVQLAHRLFSRFLANSLLDR
jgi:hypothetical protein